MCVYVCVRTEENSRREVLLYTEAHEKEWLEGNIEAVESWIKEPDEEFHHLLKQHSETKLLFPTRNILLEYDLGNLNEEKINVI